MAVLLPLSFLFIATLFYLFLRWSKIKEVGVMIYRCYYNLAKMPGPKAYPIIGSVYQFRLNSKAFTAQMYFLMNYFSFEDPNRVGLIKTWIGPIPIVTVVDADHVKTVLESNTLITKASFYDIVAEWIGTGLLISTNEKWISRRKMLTPTFHFNILKDYSEVFVKQGEILVNLLEPHSDTDREVDLFQYIKRCALDIICETAMGTEMNTQTGLNAEYVDAVFRISSMLWSYNRFPWLWLKPVWYGCGMGFEFDRLVKMTNDFTRKVIAERKLALEEEGQESTNKRKQASFFSNKRVFLDLLLSKLKTKELNEEEVDTFMFEGHDTTASAMGFVIWYLGQFPEHQKKVHEELDAVFGDSDRHPDENDIRRLVYLERCIKESLRLLPSVPVIARRLSHDIKLGGFIIPENTTVVLSPSTSQRNPEHFEHALKFYPDHFTPEAMAARHPYAYFPFSAGPRNCIGQKFAMSEEKVVLSWVFRRYEVMTIEPLPGNIPLPELILKPGDGVRCKLFKRKAYTH